MNYICQSCGEEITENRYALPYNNIDNICHVDCVEDWFEMNLEHIICDETIYVEEADEQ